MTKGYTFSAAAIITLFAVCGCSQQTINSAGHDATNDIQKLNQAANKAAAEAKPQLQKVDLGTRVTAALQAADIQNVRVDAGVKSVTLVGHVKDQKTAQRALSIAKNTLESTATVKSRLTVG